jgi:hypothetical protein
MERFKLLRTILFSISTVIFGITVVFLVHERNIAPLTLTHWVALEYLFFYAYTVYEYIKNLK